MNRPRGEIDGAALRRGGGADGAPGGGELGEDGARVGEERGARREEPHAARGTGEERRPELVLEHPDLTAERRLRDVEPPRRATHVGFFRHCHEVFDLREAHRDILRPRRAEDEIGTVLDRAARASSPLTMAISIWSERERGALRRAGRAAAGTLAHVGARLGAGVSTADIDRWVREDTRRRGGSPSQLGYHGFPAAVCTSKNEVVCHGSPSPRAVLQEGDIVNVDVTTCLDGFHGDCSATFIVGTPSAEASRLVEITRRCRDAGVAAVRPGGHLGDVGAAIEEVARAEGVTIVREYGGHGIGRVMHAEPHVPHTGRRGLGPRLRPGMAFTIEPMINLGRAEIRLLDDGWTVVTADGSLSAQFEHTVLVTEEGHEVLTAG